MSAPAKKKKTLYGRYDDYDADTSAGYDGEALDEYGNAFSDADGRTERERRPSSVRLSELTAPGEKRAARRAAPAPGSRAQTPRPTAVPVTRPPHGNDRTEEIEPYEAGRPDDPRTPRREGKPPRTPHAPRRTARIGGVPEALSAFLSDPTLGRLTVTEILPEGEGETVCVRIEGTDAAGTPFSERLRVMTEQYAALGITPGEITTAEAGDLVYASRLCAAVRKGMELLGYGDLSERRMTYKLTARGADRTIASEAAAYLKEKGLLREEDAAARRAEQDLRKLWGPRRILDDLRAQGYDRETAAAALDALADPDDPDAADYVVNCARLIRRKYRSVPDDREERRRMTAALVRLGYSPDQIREAALMIMNGDADGDGEE